jgi:ABC-2 type transport system permease protein
MVVLPLFVTLFFTSLMNEGQPVKMPIGIVDQDNTSTTRKLTRMIDAFQSSKVVAHYATAEEARHAIQRNEIYGFILFPKDMTKKLMAMRQPKMSIYYSNTSLTAGSVLYKEMKTMCTLASAAVGQATMQAKGFSSGQITAFLQPVALDAHTIGNPWISYNMFLSSMLIPACILLFVFLMTAYSLGTEIKFGTQEEWIASAGGNVYKAMLAKLLPHTFVYLVVMYACMAYMFGALHFPAPGGPWRLLLLGLISILAAQGFGVFIFGLIPSLRMAMSVCSLWGVLSFSMVGSAFPVFAMDAPLQTLSWLFPLRHYYIIYQRCIFNTFPLADAWQHFAALAVIALLPLLMAPKIKKAFLNYEYSA